MTIPQSVSRLIVLESSDDVAEATYVLNVPGKRKQGCVEQLKGVSNFDKEAFCIEKNTLQFFS